MDVNALVHRIFDEIVNNGDLEVVDEIFTEDFLDHGATGEASGREALKANIAQFRAAVPDLCCEVENLFSEGDWAAWVVRTTGTHAGDGLGVPATGKAFETVSANIGRFRDGRAAEHWSEQGMMSMLAQIGVLPAPGA
ncbi:MAG TPA: ester cyclase [Acidimicrobiales bacterium]|nr:ester cyclase [Acidimicrobiales bacterium]